MNSATTNSSDLHPLSTADFGPVEVSRATRQGAPSRLRASSGAASTANALATAATFPVRYLADLKVGKAVLWCYLLWYLSTVVHHFDPAPSLWLNALGIGVLVGIALTLSVGASFRSPQNGWKTFRLFLSPFCVSSFSSIVKGKGFFLIVPPSTDELLHSAALCVLFILAYAAAKIRLAHASGRVRA